MVGRFDFRCTSTHLTFGIDQLHRIDELATLVALITASVSIPADRIRTSTGNVPISKKPTNKDLSEASFERQRCVPLTLIAKQLFHRVFGHQISFVEFPEDVLRYPRIDRSEDQSTSILVLLSLFWSRCSTEVIEIQLKPFVNFRMQIIIFIANLSRCAFLFQSFGFRRCAILISTTEVQSIVVSQSTEPARRNERRRYKISISIYRANTSALNNDPIRLPR